MQVLSLYRTATTSVENWAPSILSVGLRVWIANIFFQAGMSKIASWGSTLALFESEYVVPLLSPALAAYLGTAVELIVPVMLALGLFTRLSAFVLCIFNAVAAISYPDISEAGMKEHVYWGILLTVPLAVGGLRFSFDGLWSRFIKQRAVHVA